MGADNQLRLRPQGAAKRIHRGVVVAWIHTRLGKGDVLFRQLLQRPHHGVVLQTRHDGVAAGGQRPLDHRVEGMGAVMVKATQDGSGA